MRNGFVKPYSPGIRRREYRHHVAIVNVMTRSWCQELSEKFTEQWQRSRDWLLPFMRNNQPKFLTKDELPNVALRQLNVFYGGKAENICSI